MSGEYCNGKYFLLSNLIKNMTPIFLSLSMFRCNCRVLVVNFLEVMPKDELCSFCFVERLEMM
jgi:hypothetical protein